MRKYVTLFWGGLLVAMQAVAAPAKNSVTDTVSMEEVVVTGSRMAIRKENVSQPISVVPRQAIEASGAADLTGVLTEQVPGLFVTCNAVMGHAGYGNPSMASGGISLRGLSASAGRTLMLIDGHPQYAALYGHALADASASIETERIEVSHGASSVLYGSNAMGGAINLITRKMEEDGNVFDMRMQGGSYGSFDLAVSNRFRSDKLMAIVAGGYRRSDGHRTNSAMRSGNGMAKVGYDFSEHWNLTGDIGLTKFYEENPGFASDPFVEGYADILRGHAELTVNDSYSRTSGSLMLYRSWGNHAIDDGFTQSDLALKGYEAARQPYLFHSTDYMNGLNVYQTVNCFEGNRLTVGMDAKQYGGTAYRNPETEVYADDVRIGEVAGYLLMQQKLWRFHVDAGVRLEHNSFYGNEWIPHAGLTFQAAKDSHLKFSVSKGFRTPSIKELYMYVSANEELLPERMWSYDVGYMQHFMDRRISMELNLFYMKGDNLVETVRVDGRPQNRNVGSFANKGVEFAMTYRIMDDLSFQCNYSFLNMDKAITGAPRHKAFASVAYSPWHERLQLTPSLLWVNGLYLTTEEAPAISSYCLLNLRAAFRLTNRLSIFVKGENLLNKTYSTIYDMPMPGIMIMSGLTLKIGAERE